MYEQLVSSICIFAFFLSFAQKIRTLTEEWSARSPSTLRLARRMSSALVNAARRALTQRARTAPVRSFNTSAPKRGGEGEPVRARAPPDPSRGSALPLADDIFARVPLLSRRPVADLSHPRFLPNRRRTSTPRRCTTSARCVPPEPATSAFLRPSASPLPEIGSPARSGFLHRDDRKLTRDLPSSPATPQTKGRSAVFGAACAAVVLIGGYIPVYAIQFQQRKASG